MPLVVEFSDRMPHDWNEQLVAAGREAGFQQTALWGDLIETMGLGRSIYATVHDSLRPVLLALFTISHPPSRLGKLRAQIMCTDGPVVLDPTLAGEAFAALLDAVERRLLLWRLADIRFEGLAKTTSLNESDGVVAAFAAHGYACEPWATYLVDISGTEDEVLARIGRKAREKLRRAGRLEVAIRKIDGADDFLANVNPVYEAGGAKSPVTANRARASFAASAASSYDYLIASDMSDGAALAVGGICVWGGIALRISTSITPTARERRIPAQELLTWETIRLARNRGATVYDFAGVNPEPKTPKEIGIRDFKAKWGGRLMTYPRWVKRSPALTALGRWRDQRVHG